jgi:hypothetical protein
VADRLVAPVAADPRASVSHEQSARLYQLYTEIFADRGSLCVTGNLEPVVSGLVKVETGLSTVSATSYLKQAAEIFAKPDVRTQELSHPETFIRTQALALWQSMGDTATPQIIAMIEGSATLEQLDLLGQQHLTQATRQLLEQFLQPKWFQTASVLGHARLFFNDFKPSGKPGSPWKPAIKLTDPKLRDYLGYMLLDFVTVDPDLDEMPLAAALEWSRQLEMEESFEKLLVRELKMKARDIKRLKEQAAGMLAKAEVEHE